MVKLFRGLTVYGNMGSVPLLSGGFGEKMGKVAHYFL